VPRVTKAEPFGGEGLDESIEVDLFRVHHYLIHPAVATPKSHVSLAA